MNNFIVEAKNVCMSFSNVEVLHNINVTFKNSKIYGIVGENGAGKSTLMKIISGFLIPSKGEISINGEKIILNPIKASKLGIVLIPQELNLVDTLKVYENVFLGDEMTDKLLLNKNEMIKRTRNLFDRFSLKIDPETLVEKLTPSQKQMIEIVKALNKNAKLLIMDEPTSALSDEEVEILFNVVKDLKKDGVSVIFISHRLKEVKMITDHLIVLRDGHKVFEGSTKNLNEKKIAEMMVGRKLEEMYPEKPIPKKEVIFEVKNLSSLDEKVQNVSFKLFKGEVLGFYGLVGSGRTELMETIIGLRKKKNGQIILKQKKITLKNPEEAKLNGIVYLPEDRKSSGIIGILEAFKNTTLMSLEKFSKILLNTRQEIKTFKIYKDKFSIKVRDPYQIVNTLSGGNQQKVVISKLVETGAKIFLFDEPTRGVDVNAKHQIYEIIKSLIDELDASFVIVSSDLPEIIGICNRVIVMHNGKIVAEVKGKDINENNLILYATGLKKEVD
ncbi:MAG: ribose transport system ATP-binding protein [Geotoga sp.]|jgi:ribose transport system ATP-binding protein|nr:ribose transport system ATP-binding protein [Geotoga sp.]